MQAVTGVCPSITFILLHNSAISFPSKQVLKLAEANPFLKPSCRRTDSNMGMTWLSWSMVQLPTHWRRSPAIISHVVVVPYDICCHCVVINRPSDLCPSHMSSSTIETVWISQLIPQTFFCGMSCEIRTALFTKQFPETCSAKQTMNCEELIVKIFHAFC